MWSIKAQTTTVAHQNDHVGQVGGARRGDGRPLSDRPNLRGGGTPDEATIMGQIDWTKDSQPVGGGHASSSACGFLFFGAPKHVVRKRNAEEHGWETSLETHSLVHY